jgi:hypothetical protein
VGELGTKTGKPINLRLSAAADDKLTALAQSAGIRRTTLATALLEELLPSVSGVRQRLQIERSQNGAPSRG